MRLALGARKIRDPGFFPAKVDSVSEVKEMIGCAVILHLVIQACSLHWNGSFHTSFFNALLNQCCDAVV